LLAIKRANGTRDGSWRRAMGASMTAVAQTTRWPPTGFLRRSSPPRSVQGMRRDASLARGRKGCFARGENARVPCQFFPNVWPFEILAEPRCKANRSSQRSLHPPL